MDADAVLALRVDRAGAYERALATGDPAAAMVEIIKGTGDRSPIRHLPRFILVHMLRLAIEKDARKLASGDIAIKDLVPTMRLDETVVRESVAMVNPRISELRSEVLLLGGEKSAHPHRLALDAVENRLPGSTRVELKGVGHLAADNRGAPHEVAQLLDAFFTR